MSGSCWRASRPRVLVRDIQVGIPPSNSARRVATEMSLCSYVLKRKPSQFTYRCVARRSKTVSTSFCQRNPWYAVSAWLTFEERKGHST